MQMQNQVMQQQQQQVNQNNINASANMLNKIKANPEQFARNLMARNPDFQKFVEQNRGKSIEQIAEENGIPMQHIQSFMM